MLGFLVLFPGSVYICTRFAYKFSSVIGGRLQHVRCRDVSPRSVRTGHREGAGVDEAPSHSSIILSTHPGNPHLILLISICLLPLLSRHGYTRNMPCTPPGSDASGTLTALSPEIRSSIMSFMDFRALTRYRALSTFTYVDVAEHYKHRLSALLAPYVNPQPFLDQLTRSCGVVSGSFALTFIYNLAWLPGDVDIYAPDYGFQDILLHLLHVEGYKLEPNPFAGFLDLFPSVFARATEPEVPSSPLSSPYPRRTRSSHIRVVARLHKGHRKIDVICSRTSSALMPITAFWTSIVQNFVTPTMFCTGYPSSVSLGRGVIHLTALSSGPSPTGRTVSLIRKYEARGFTFRLVNGFWTSDTFEHRCVDSDNGHCPIALRFFGDGHCGGGFIGAPVAVRGVFEGMHGTCVWWRGGRTCGGECSASGLILRPGAFAYPMPIVW